MISFEALDSDRRGNSDTGLYNKTKREDQIYILLYVDDMLVASYKIEETITFLLTYILPTLEPTLLPALHPILKLMLFIIEVVSKSFHSYLKYLL